MRGVAYLRASMTLVVVGSIAFDAVKTPFGERERMLGGSAVHFSLAASFFTDVRVVGPVGGDFGAEEESVLTERGINTEDIERVEGGKTFFWRGHYEYDLNTAHTDDTQLNVFGEFQPKLSDVLARGGHALPPNIQPDLQRDVREQCTGVRLAGLDSMNLWIETPAIRLCGHLRRGHGVHERRRDPHAHRARPTWCGRPASDGDGAQDRGGQAGRVGAALFTEEGFFALPAYPLETVMDPTGQVTRSPAAFLGYLASQTAPPTTQPAPRDDLRLCARLVQRREFAPSG